MTRTEIAALLESGAEPFLAQEWCKHPNADLFKSAAASMRETCKWNAINDAFGDVEQYATSCVPLAHYTRARADFCQFCGRTVEVIK